MNTRTVFVIGAGASEEAKLPTGHDLKKKIANLLDMRFEFYKQETGDYLIADALREHVKLPDGRGGDINPYLHEAWHIRDALPQAISIDNFIDSQRDNEKIALCGKLAIVRSILDAEKNSHLFFDKFGRNPGLNYSLLEKTWYISFFQLLTENCEVNDLEKRFKSVALIVFNYDRCIEHFLYNALQNYYRVTEAEAASLVKNIEIFHPYGSVGFLPWRQLGAEMEFGAKPNAKQLLDLTNKIKTFTEGTEPGSSDILSIKKHMCNAGKLVFLGFAFHKLNMQLITTENCDRQRGKKPICYATTLGISNSDKEVIENQVNNLYSTNINVKMENLVCSEFFSEFWRSLAF